MKRSEELAAHLDSASRFKDEFERLIRMIEEHEEADHAARTSFRDLSDPTPWGQPIKTQRAEVGRLSGPAAMAATAAGVHITMQDPAVIGGRIKTINPLQGWFQALEDHPLGLSKDDVLDAANQTIGILEAELRTAERIEHSLAGRVAQIMGFADQVRGARGLPRDTRAGRVTFWVTVAGQVVAAVVTVWVLWLLARAGATIIDVIG